MTRREMQTGILVTAQHFAGRDWLLVPHRFRGVRLEDQRLYCLSKSLDYIYCALLIELPLRQSRCSSGSCAVGLRNNAYMTPASDPAKMTVHFINQMRSESLRNTARYVSRLKSCNEAPADCRNCSILQILHHHSTIVEACMTNTLI